MNLKFLSDNQLNLDTKKLVADERALLTQILYHLQEIESRKLFSAYRCASLFDYACRELKYSADQAYRRIQAMRLLKEIPAVAAKIDSGELSLANLNQAQRFFNETPTSKPEKLRILETLTNKSARDGQKELLKLAPEKFLPAESKKQITPTHTQVTFTMSEELEEKLKSVRALLGPKAYGLNMAELIHTMADLAQEKLLEKKFGKKRIAKTTKQHTVHKPEKSSQIMNVHKGSRYISKQIKYDLWKDADSKCTLCKSTANLQYDHIQPLALNGTTAFENLRLVCFHCNQRQRITAGL